LVILLFGITNVGKTVTGARLAEKLGYSFFDLDEEIKINFKQL
jgi:shikimate kinase